MRSVAGRTVLLVIVVAALAAPAFTQGERPAVRIVSPEPGGAVRGPNVVIEMEVLGVQLTPRRSSNGAYVLLRMDEAPPAKGYASTFTFQDLATGNHLLRVELRHTDGTAFIPAVRAQVRFSVRNGEQ